MTLTAAHVTRTAQAATSVRFTSTQIAPGVVRTRIAEQDVTDPASIRRVLRTAAAVFIQQGHDASVSAPQGAWAGSLFLTVTEAEDSDDFPAPGPWGCDAPTVYCEWYALCTNEADGLVAHPILGNVPTCTRCADKHSLTLKELDK